MIALVIGLASALWGCTPAIEEWRDIYGISKNDPGPDAPFTQNLADAEAKPYPNLASVPPPPTRATTAAERQKLEQRLVAERAAVAAAGEAVAPPSRANAAAPLPAHGAPAASAAALAAPAATAEGAAPPSAAVKTATAEPHASSPQSGRRAAAAPTQPPPPNSTLQTPEINSLPEPEAARPAPPPAQIPAETRLPVAAGPSPAAIASAKPEAPPAVPNLAPPPPPPPAAGKPAAKATPGLVTVATLTGAAGGSNQAEIARLAARYKQQPGRVRVIAYTAAPAGGGDPLASYQAALDRAQAIAKALSAAGIPAGKIQTEATPAAASAGGDRIEVQFGP